MTGLLTGLFDQCTPDVAIYISLSNCRRRRLPHMFARLHHGSCALKATLPAAALFAAPWLLCADRFEARNVNELRFKVLRGSYARLPSVYSVDLQQVVCSCLDQVSERRPSMEAILACRGAQARMHLVPVPAEVRGTTSVSVCHMAACCVVYLSMESAGLAKPCFQDAYTRHQPIANLSFVCSVCAAVSRLTQKSMGLHPARCTGFPCMPGARA